MKELVAWKDKRNRKPLIIRGARQVGKTWIMQEFGKQFFERTVYINLDSNLRMRAVFEGTMEPGRILAALAAETGKAVEPANTLIIFDEIQESPRALASLKYFFEEEPDCTIIAAGSLLGVALHKGTSFPVGKVEFLDLYPMNFREFLLAFGDDSLVGLLDQRDWEMIRAFKEKLIDRLRQYYYIGGMPEVVSVYLETSDYGKVRDLQKQILEYYQMDFSKHAETALVPKLDLVWHSVVGQLAKENRKFIYGQIRKGARAKEFELAIQWLEDCGLIHKVCRVRKPGYPLAAYAELDSFKIFLCDVGLLGAMADISSRTILEGNQLFKEFKGALTEQYVLQELKAEIHTAAYYYSAENSRGEIDFLLQAETGIVPMEVKAEENLRAKSLRAFCDKYETAAAIRTSMSDYRKEDWLVNIPLYALCTAADYLKL